MNTLLENFKSIATIPLFILLSMLLFSCSNESTEIDKKKYDHTHAESIDMKKHLFEHIFAEQCIADETANLADKKAGQKRFAKPCMCIAVYLFKDLTAKDSYSLLNDKKHANSLREKYEEASEQCL